MDRVKREGYTNDSYDHRREVASLKKDSDPWVSSSGFGLANILNRNNSSAPRSNMSTFNLPSLHSFGKSLLNKPEMPIARQNYEENRRFTSTRLQHHRRSVDLSPPQLSSPDSHRVTMAAAEEDKIDQDMDGTRSNNGTLSIRGGRWTADEHERFLEGFRIHGHKWKRVQQVVRTRSVTQVRTHAQKYLLKVAKLKAEKKQSGKTVDMATLAAEQSSRSTAAEVIDDHSTAPSTPEQGCSDQSPRKTPRKNVRRLDHGNCDPVDQEYIAAAATTLCFLMSQKIDSLLDTRHEPHVEVNKVEYEPYDCYAASSAIPSEVEHSRSRKRTYMHFITDQEDDYASSYDTARGERPSYTIEGKKLCS